jgi:hypothetical protein
MTPKALEDEWYRLVDEREMAFLLDPLDRARKVAAIDAKIKALEDLEDA